MQTFTYTKETDTDVWKLEAILQPINSAPNVRTPSFIDAVETSLATIDISPISPGANLAPTMHRGFQVVQHQVATNLAPTSAPKEFNPVPLIFAGLMSVAIGFHVYGGVQYYRGSTDNRVECKQ